MPNGAAFITDQPGPAAVLALAGVLTLGLVALVLRQVTRAAARLAAPARVAIARVALADRLTYVAAAIATAVAAQGMWLVFRDVLHIEVFLRAGMFGFLELAVLTSAVRARRSMREHGSAGVDGVAVWVLTSTSAVLSAMHAASFTAAVLRLAAPLVAAWLWERGMAVERRRLTSAGSIHWSFTLERVLVRLGLAEPTGRTVGQVAVERRLTRLALAARAARTLPPVGWRRARAMRRLDRAMRQAVTTTAVASDRGQQQYLLAQLAALSGGDSLITAIQLAPWHVPGSGTVSVLGAHQEAHGAPGNVTAPDTFPATPFLPAIPTPIPQAIPEPTLTNGAAVPIGQGQKRAPGAPDHHQDCAPAARFPHSVPVDVRALGTREAGPKSTNHDDAQIVAALAEADQLPSIRALMKQYSVGFPKAKLLLEVATTRRNQNPIHHQTKIDTENLPEAPTSQHFEHTPMQLVDVGQPSAPPNAATGQ